MTTTKITRFRFANVRPNVLLITGALILASFVFVYARSSRSAVPRRAMDGHALTVRTIPLAPLPEDNRPDVQIPAARLRAVIDQVADHDFSRWNQLIHGLRVWGAGAEGPGNWSGPKVVEIVCSSEKARERFGSAPHVLNRNGLHFAQEESSGEKHVDETLSVLAEAGIASNRPVQLIGHTTTVAEGVRASVSNFVMEQRLDFSVLAFAHYLPPQKDWTNKFGETISFDDVCQRLCDLPFGEGFCYGAHVMYTLSMVLSADRQEPLLSETTRRRVRSKLRDAITLLRETQRETGCWDTSWFDPKKPAAPSDFAGTLSVTGHSLEWLAVAPQDLIDDPQMVSRGCDGLLTLMLNTKQVTLNSSYNACTHALRAFKLWCPRAWNEVLEAE